MMRKLYFLIIISFILTIPAWADPQVSDDAQRQLSSQTNILTKEIKKFPEKPAEKPQIETQKETPQPPVEEGPVFFVKKIVLEGNTIIPTKNFESYTTAFENRKASFAQLRSLSEIITNIYRSQGYITSRAYLPPQTIENGIVTIKIIEGKVEKVFVEGNKNFSTKSYQKYMKFDSSIFRYQELEAGLYRLNQNPDRQAKAFLIAGEQLASSDIILKATDRSPIHAYYDFNNRGTKLTHRARDEFHLDHHNLLGYDDSLSTSVTTSEEAAFRSAAFSYQFPIADTPVDLEFSGGYVQTKLIGYLKPDNIIGKSLNLSPGITYHLIEKPESEVSLHGSLEYVNSLSTIAGSRTSIDRVRALQFGPRFTWQDAGGRTLFSGEGHWGLPGFMGGLDAHDANSSVNNAAGDFTVYVANLTRLQRLPASMFLIARISGQWSPDTLNSVEQYRAGGVYTVRGYPESDAAGDYGWNASTELSAPIGFIPNSVKIPFTKKSWSDSLRVVGFLDGAKTYFREKALLTNVKDKFLLGTGFGFRLNIDDYLSAQADLGFPIGDDSSDKNNKQLHFSLRAGF